MVSTDDFKSISVAVACAMGNYCFWPLLEHCAALMPCWDTTLELHCEIFFALSAAPSLCSPPMWPSNSIFPLYTTPEDLSGD